MAKSNGGHSRDFRYTAICLNFPRYSSPNVAHGLFLNLTLNNNKNIHTLIIKRTHKRGIYTYTHAWTLIMSDENLQSISQKYISGWNSPDNISILDTPRINYGSLGRMYACVGFFSFVLLSCTCFLFTLMYWSSTKWIEIEIMSSFCSCEC